MGTIKSYTNIKQSKELAKILPIESADMLFQLGEDKYADSIRVSITKKHWEQMMPDINPCWSLASLLSVIKKYGLIDLRFLYSTFDNKGTHLTNVWNLIFEDIGNVSLDIYADTPIDACYEMIIRLHELKML